MHILTPVLSGRVGMRELRIDGRLRYASASLSVGRFDVIRAGETPHTINAQSRTLRMHLYLPDKALQRMFDDDCENDRNGFELLPVSNAADPDIERVSREIYAEMLKCAPASRLMLDGLTLVLAAHMVRRWSNRGESRAFARGGLAPAVLRRVVEYLEAHLADDPGLAELARISGLSMKHFARAFKQSSGLAPHQWLMRRRIERARHLLADSPLDLAQVALECGFVDQSHFTATFKRATGATPGAFRRSVSL